MMNWGVVISGISIAITVLGLIFTTGRFSQKLESQDERMKEQFMQLQKYSGEFFERIQRLEVWQGGQNEINKGTTQALKDIKDQLVTIESLLRSR